MNKNLMIAADSTLGGGSYDSPTAHVVEIRTEGVLCASTLDNMHETWGEEDLW